MSVKSQTRQYPKGRINSKFKMTTLKHIKIAEVWIFDIGIWNLSAPAPFGSGRPAGTDRSGFCNFFPKNTLHLVGIITNKKTSNGIKQEVLLTNFSGFGVLVVKKRMPRRYQVTKNHKSMFINLRVISLVLLVFWW